MGRSISNRRPARFEKWVEFHGTWMVPPHQGMWIPGGVRHSIAMLNQVATRSVYLDQRAARGMPRRCEVVGVSPLLRQPPDPGRGPALRIRSETPRRPDHVPADRRNPPGAGTAAQSPLPWRCPAAFTTMFKKLIGTSPHTYRRAAS
jgi:hypothetical protein